MITQTLNPLSWQHCLSCLHLWGENPEFCKKTFSKIQTAHAEPQRFYHTANHINACLRWVDVVEDKLKQPEWIRLAFYFHDAIYNPKAKTNEEQSAVWAVEFLKELAAPNDMVTWVKQAILATKAHTQTDNLDTAYLLDIDISILGQTPDVYMEYAQAVRQEYAHVSAKDYKQGRTEVLTHFLETPTIYQTAYFRDRLESQARKNLLSEVSLLKK